MATRLVSTAERTMDRASQDAPLVLIAMLHAAVLITAPSVPVVAVGLWWNANTVAHNFIHRPFFRTKWANRLFSMFLSLVLGLPQSYWRARHLRHHRSHERAPEAPEPGGTFRVNSAMAIETAGIVSLWALLVSLDSHFFLTVYAPGYLAGLGLCALHGHYEHAGGTTSHYGWLYNALFFNDGYHVEHHRRPHVHWADLRGDVRPGTRCSRWPAVLRWLESGNVSGAPVRHCLTLLERVVLRSPVLQRFVLNAHERAFRRLQPDLGDIRSVTIVGGGLFPRTALILRRLMPDAAITVVEAEAWHLELARSRLDRGIALVHATYDPASSTGADLVVVPLAYRGDRRRLYCAPPAAQVLIHDWIWARRAAGVRVSWLLLKRLNLVRQ